MRDAARASSRPLGSRERPTAPGATRLERLTALAVTAVGIGLHAVFLTQAHPKQTESSHDANF